MYDIFPPSCEDGGSAHEGLFWSCKVVLPDLTMRDNRPEMRARALDFVSTKQGREGWATSSGARRKSDDGECTGLSLVFSKTRQFHIGLGIAAKQVSLACLR